MCIVYFRPFPLRASVSFVCGHAATIDPHQRKRGEEMKKRGLRNDANPSGGWVGEREKKGKYTVGQDISPFPTYELHRRTKGKKTCNVCFSCCDALFMSVYSAGYTLHTRRRETEKVFHSPSQSEEGGKKELELISPFSFSPPHLLFPPAHSETWEWFCPLSAVETERGKHILNLPLRRRGLPVSWSAGQKGLFRAGEGAKAKLSYLVWEGAVSPLSP